MALFEDEDDEDFEPEAVEKNLYLEDPERGIELISKLLSYDKNSSSKRKTIKKLDYLLDRKLLETSGKVNIKNELELYEKLINLSDKLYEQNKLQLLRDRSVIGLGGKFSAGKSKFINALMKSDILPEDQTPTTSIATYIVKEQDEAVRAYTYNDQDIALDMQAAQALTHAFHKKYGLGFSSFINNLVINVPDFQYSNVAILDTPGYSKDDSGMKRSVSDAEKAYTQLRTVDFLIWLVDIENGVIQQPDIEFIRGLKPKNPVLVVFNKADKKPPDVAKSILESSREILNSSGINIYAVIAYSALYEEEYFGTNYLTSFLKDAHEATNRNEDIEEQIYDIINTISRSLASERKRLLERRNQIGNTIFHSEDVLEIQTLVKLYAEVIKSLEELEETSRAVETITDRITNLLSAITKE